MVKGWFSSIKKVVFSCKEAVSLWVFAEMTGYETGALFTVMKKAVFAVITCSVALGGATVGIFTGAIKGQTTETGFLRGAGIGAMAGAITAVQLMVHGEPFSKVALFSSLVNGKVFTEWVTPAVLKAYQWQISALETSFMEISDIYDITGNRGLSQDTIKKLPTQIFHSSQTIRPCHDSSCTICLEDFKNGDFTRILPSCRHSFHLHCIDEWLIRHGSCPICREDV
ncbi:hypothetical protein F0562_010101 [Nyssa sinensis]|uniref:RING-type domain-containing protein n=1 Tax=Nyssa sinensis TaxID=561372 RepID=A0A5J5A153_9ASTE|nr:hypothetical protein F0562_010101 [Nyssa sinensis]